MKLFRTSNKTNTVLERNKTLVKGMNLAERQVLDRSQIELGPLLGQGGFAKVYSCTLDGQKAVVKVIPSDKLNDEMIYLLNNEVAVWCNLVHRNITTFYGMAYTEKAIWLVCEFMKDGSLMDHHEKMRKQKAPPPDMPTLLGQIHQISSGCAQPLPPPARAHATGRSLSRVACDRHRCRAALERPIFTTTAPDPDPPRPPPPRARVQHGVLAQPQVARAASRPQVGQHLASGGRRAAGDRRFWAGEDTGERGREDDRRDGLVPMDGPRGHQA